MEYKSLRKMMREFLVSQKKNIIVSVSVVSLIFSNSCWLSSFMSYLKLYFSAFPFHLLGHGLNKNCAFLVCNGLLVFVAKTSGSFRSSGSGFDLDEMLDKKMGYGNLQTTLETKEPEPLLIKYEEEEEEEVVVVVVEVEEENEGGNEVNEAAEAEGEKAEEQNKTTNLVMEDLPGDGGRGGGEGDGKNKIEGSENENELEVALFSDGQEEQQDQEEEEEECMERLSTEELNKKFEEFIRKMKEEIRKGRLGSSAGYSQVNYNYDINLYDKNWPIMIVYQI